MRIGLQRPGWSALIGAGSLMALALGACGSPAMNPTPDMAAGGGDMAGGGGDMAGGGGDCASVCNASPMAAARKVCGSDGKTYSECDWSCGKIAKGINASPGACTGDGKPQPDAPPPADGVMVCDYDQIDGVWAPIMCASDETGLDGADPYPVQVWVLPGPPGFFDAAAPPNGGPRPPAPPPPPDTKTGVDHTARFTPPRNQNPSPCCQTFAAVGLIEANIASQTGSKDPLSEMHLWAKTANAEKQDPFDHFKVLKQAMLTGVATKAAADAAMLPWDATLARSWAPPSEGTSVPVDTAKIAAADMVGDFQVGSDWSVVIYGNGPGCRLIQNQIACKDADAYVAKVQELIGRGFDIVAGIGMNQDKWNEATTNNGKIGEYLQKDSNGAHSVVLVGYKQIDGKDYFMLRNSWGPTWGVGGYGYISFDTFKANNGASGGITVKKYKADNVQDCGMGKVPSLDGSCRTLCMDGSISDAKGNCAAQMTMCPMGQAPDAAGVCVTSCTAGTKETMDGEWKSFKRVCTTAGCVYTIPDGKPGCKAKTMGGTCQMYCPAPSCGMAISYASDDANYANPIANCIFEN